MSRKSDNAEERRAQADRVLSRADRQDPYRKNRERRILGPRRTADDRAASSSPKKGRRRRAPPES
jgi:hypothetical protein